MPNDLESSILRKTAWRLVPFLCLGNLINSLDRYNISIAALTMNKALSLSATAYGMAAGIYFWSYVCCQVPANLMLRRFGARVWLPTIMALWGIASAGTAFAQGETSLVAARFVLGLTEARYFPGVTYFMTCWFPARYRGRTMGLFFAASALASVLGAPLSGNLLRLDGWFGVAGWQWVFLVEAAPAVLLAIYGYAMLRNHPAEAIWLNPAERAFLADQLDREAQAKPAHGMGFFRAIANPRIIMITIAFALTLYGAYSIAFFLPLIIKGLGLSNTAVGYVTALPSVCGAAGMILVSRHSDRTGERFWHVICPVTLAAVGLIGAALFIDNVWLAMAAFCLAVFGASSTLPVFWNLPTAYFGAAGAAAGIGAINTIGNISGYMAPQVMGILRDASGGYMVPVLVSGVLTGLAPVLILASGIRRYLGRAVVV